MSWGKAFEYVKGIGKERGVLDKPKQEDDGLPLGARIGSVVSMQASPFLRAETAGSLVKMPDPLQDVIRAIGRLKLDFPGKIYRYYLQTGDHGPQSERFIQVVSDQQGNVLERMYCERLVRFVPESRADQEAFTGESSDGLGQKFYLLYPDQLNELGFSPEQIQAALAGEGAVTYEREAGAADADFVRPFKGSEVRIDDAQGEHGLEQTIWFMPHVRDVGGMREYLLISTEEIRSQDGSDKRAMYVDLVVGVALEESRISIQ